MRSALLPALLVAVVPLTAFAHARLEYPPPRSQKDGIKTNPPCGLDPRTAPTVLEPGQTITVTWEETITHPGHYRIAFSPANDQGFDQHVLADNIPNPSGLQNGSKQVTLPSTPCEGCSLQLIQVMTNTTPPSNYYSCADIALRVADAGSDAGSAADGGATSDAGTGVDAGSIATDGGSAEDGGEHAHHENDAGTQAHEDGGHASHDGGGTVTGGCSATKAELVAFALLASSLPWLRSHRRKRERRPLIP